MEIIVMLLVLMVSFQGAQYIRLRRDLIKLEDDLHTFKLNQIEYDTWASKETMKMLDAKQDVRWVAHVPSEKHPNISNKPVDTGSSPA